MQTLRGLTEEEIVAAFLVGVISVKQPLRLASIPPSLLEIYAMIDRAFIGASKRIAVRIGEREESASIPADGAADAVTVGGPWYCRIRSDLIGYLLPD